MGELVVFDPKRHMALLPSFVDLHVATIEYDDALMRFMPPFTQEKRAIMLEWWMSLIAEVERDERVIVMNVHRDEKGEEASGVVMLEKPVAETGPFRGNIVMLMVSPNHRRLGMAKRMMNRVESIALEQKRTLLMLSTTTGSPAEEVYPRLGYVKMGQIPDFGYSPKDGQLTHGTFFYKHLVKLSSLDVS